jgi:isoleucyl-tRNA synthetase
MFEPLPPQFNFPETEEQILRFWEQHQVFEQSLAQRADSPRFVFYEGPPTANGLPHPGHVLTRTIKDLFPRYHTMCGKLVERKAGWDTHGLPVEVEVCKELGIHTKEEIEQHGVENFVRLCIDSVFRYVREWEQMTRRLGFWVNLDKAYVTFHQSYVESVWWGLKTLFERGLLYQGHKVVWWWAQGGTALSAGEVGEGYRTVQDPSIYVRFPLIEATERRSGEATETGEGTEARRHGGTEGGMQPRVTSAGASETPLPSREGSGEGQTAPAPHEFLPAGATVSLLVWTTTPWTLVSNHFAAVGPDIDYALVRDAEADEYFYLATALVEPLAQKLKRELETLGTCKGTDLVGLRYAPPFDCFEPKHGAQTATPRSGPPRPVAWRIVDADFVDISTGTGIVHVAPAFGEVDFNRLQQEREDFADLDAIPLINAVKPDGTFGDDAPEPYRGRWVKDCDKDIIRELKERGVLLHQETIEHEYPFCPRAEDDALIQYARKSWFVRTSQFKDEFLANNDGIYWLPDHIKEGRFGDFLRNNVDWALSRERFWGTPLPIWVCEQTGQMEAIGALEELKARPGATDATDEYPEGMWATKKAADPSLPDHLMVHKPYIDAWTYDSPFAPDARMRRVPEVIDCWWDAGSMPFAQWGFPHAPGSIQTFADRFPADFISEALDQTRGWFYGLLAISTLLFGEQRANDKLPDHDRIPDPRQGHPYKACIVLGLMLGEDGLKMSKRKKNYREPSYIFDHYGADAMRWFLFSGQTPWTSIRFEEQNIRDAHREFLVRLYNVFSFFNIYARIDGFIAHPQHGSPWRPIAERGELDRWIVSELHRTTRFVREKLDAFENYPAAGRLNDFVDALSNWYVRRSRDRFWRSEKDQDKWDAYHTLYGVLLELSKLIAPFTPFFAETMYQNLKGNDQAPPSDLPVSVHLCDYPAVDDTQIDEDLSQEMDLVRQIVSLGRAARTSAKLKVRQPLALVEIILTRQEHADWLGAHNDLVAEELNIKQVEFSTEAEQYVTYQVKPNFKAIGPRFGKQAKQVAATLAKVDPAESRRQLTESGAVTVDLAGESIRLSEDEVELRLEAKPGWSAAQGRAGVVVVKTELTDELRAEGVCRELIHQIQALRKDQDLPYEARIAVYIDAPDEITRIADRFADTIQRECLADRIEKTAAAEKTGPTRAKIEGHPVTLAITRVSPS